jgi:hypothetical protein
LEGGILLQSVIELQIWLDQSDVDHGQKGLLDALAAVQESLRELLTGD